MIEFEFVHFIFRVRAHRQNRVLKYTRNPLTTGAYITCAFVSAFGQFPFILYCKSTLLVGHHQGIIAVKTRLGNLSQFFLCFFRLNCPQIIFNCVSPKTVQCLPNEIFHFFFDLPSLFDYKTSRLYLTGFYLELGAFIQICAVL